MDNMNSKLRLILKKPKCVLWEKAAVARIVSMLITNLNSGLPMIAIKHIFAFSIKKEYVELEINVVMPMGKENCEKKDNLNQNYQ